MIFFIYFYSYLRHSQKHFWIFKANIHAWNVIWWQSIKNQAFNFSSNSLYVMPYNMKLEDAFFFTTTLKYRSVSEFTIVVVYTNLFWVRGLLPGSIGRTAQFLQKKERKPLSCCSPRQIPWMLCVIGHAPSIFKELRWPQFIWWTLQNTPSAETSLLWCNGCSYKLLLPVSFSLPGALYGVLCLGANLGLSLNSCSMSMGYFPSYVTVETNTELSIL